MIAKTEEIENWLAANPNAEVSEYESRQKELERLFNPLITKIYQGGDGGSCGAQAQQGYGTSAPNADEVD